MSTPRISIVLAVRNAASILGGTLDSLRAQGFRDFVVVVVDGASTDGTLELLQAASADLPLRLVSEPDRSVGDALAKGLARATGDIVGILCADERYDTTALAQAAAWFDAHPDAVMCGGRLDMVDEKEQLVERFLGPPHDHAAHLACEQVEPILASFFNRRMLGAELRYDGDIPTCPDYELWGRLGFLYPQAAFKRFDIGVARAFRTRDSMSFRAESFDWFCRDKRAHLDKLLDRFVAPEQRDAVRRRAAAGIHMWAAEQLHAIDFAQADLFRHCTEAARLDPRYPRIARFVATTGRATYDPATGTVTETVPIRPGPRTASVEGKISIGFDRQWKGVQVVSQTPLSVRTADADWGYSLMIRAALPPDLPKGRPWLSVEVEVPDGAVGIGRMVGQELTGERFVRNGDGRTKVALPLGRGAPEIVMFRSGGRGGSVVRLYASELQLDPDDERA